MVITKVNDEQRIVSGVAMVSALPDGTPLVDRQGDVVEPAELERAFIDYALTSREGDTMHDKQPAARLVEMLVVTPEKLADLCKALGCNVTSDYRGAAVYVSFRVDNPETWAAIKAGKLRAFSIEAEATREATA